MFGFSLTKSAIYGAIIALTLAGVTGAFFKFRHDQRMVGWNKALSEVAEQNRVAAESAAKVRLNVDRCYDQGGDWNVSTGECDLPEAATP